MGAIRLGANPLRWCHGCNLPILEERNCPLCGKATKQVSLTPPSDCRPAFSKDVDRIRSLADRQFGEGCGHLLLPRDRIVILNRCPSLDRMDEIVVDGDTLGAVIYDLPKREKIVLRPSGAARMLKAMITGRVVADGGALPSISKGSNLMGPGVVSADESIAKDDDIAVLSESGEVIGTGLARISGSEMSTRPRGVSVKIRWTTEKSPIRYTDESKGNSWDEVVEANREQIDRIVRKAVDFIKKVCRKHEKPVAVSFSGGKDSLATLYLSLESGIRPYILFVDTGIELPETLKEVERVAEETGLTLLTESAGEAFWEGLEIFGPPGKDFRWCCKSCKLGPATRIIRRNFPDGVVSLIGQRSYESEQRMLKGAEWTNPWTPGQIGASPIQNWTALYIWLYIFSRKIRYNPWYEMGLDRIGCYMCPSSDIAELDVVKSQFAGFERWDRYLEDYREKRRLPVEWSTLALWRWKRTPPAMRNKLEELKIALPKAVEKWKGTDPFMLRRTDGYQPCTSGGLSSEGVFTGGGLDLERVANLMNAVGPVELKENEMAMADGIIVFQEGAVTIKGEDEETIDDKSARLEKIVRRAMFCIGCGICTARCRSGALSVGEAAVIDPVSCSHCGECLGPCPVDSFERIEEI